MKILFPKKSRELILDKISKNQAPKEFFYGSISNGDFDIHKQVVDTRPEIENFSLGFTKKLLNNILNSSFSKEKAKYIFESIPNESKVLSFTDWDSMNIAIHHNLRKDLKLICGFHGLYNFFQRMPQNIFLNKKKIFTEGLNDLNHIFFFGPEDRRKCIQLFKIPENKTSIYRFGVDIDFWKKKEFNETIDILSIGSDLNRNYDIFNEININFKLSLITKLNVKKLKKKATIISGSKNNPFLTDLEIRDFYNKSKIIVIPIKETLQPSGYSVALQAMACGKPVIMTKIKGLWDQNNFKNMHNIIFVSPNNPMELEKSIKLLLGDSNLRFQMGKEARKTVENFFSLKRMNQDFQNLINLFK